MVTASPGGIEFAEGMAEPLDKDRIALWTFSDEYRPSPSLFPEPAWPGQDGKF